MRAWGEALGNRIPGDHALKVRLNVTLFSYYHALSELDLLA